MHKFETKAANNFVFFVASFVYFVTLLYFRRMEKRIDYSQLFLRVALGLGFIFPVMDRLGLFGGPGENGNGWGNWSNFVSYTNTLMPYMNASATNVMALIATAAEIIFGITLIIGYKTRYAAVGSCLLTLAFALSMFSFQTSVIHFHTRYLSTAPRAFCYQLCRDTDGVLMVNLVNLILNCNHASP